MNNFSSSIQRKFVSLILRILSYSFVSFSVGIKSGGFGDKIGIDNNGSSGNTADTGQTFFATVLYVVATWRES